MRIIYLHQYFVTPEMNGGTRSYEFAKRLVAAGHQVHMITSDRTKTGEPYETVEAGIRVTWIPVRYSNRMGAFARIRAFITFAVRSALIAARSEADIIFATSTPLTIAIPGVYAKRRRKVPMVFEVRDPWPDMLIGLGAIRNPFIKFAAHRFERFAYRNSERIIALSEGMKEVVTSTGYPQERVTVIPNASDTHRFGVPASEGQAFRQQFEWLRNRKLVLYAGTIGTANGVDYLVQTAKAMLAIDDEVRFLTIGTGGQEQQVRALAEETGTLGRNFFMLPPLPKSAIPACFSATDLSLVLLKDVKELWTNSSNKFFDGLAAGRPVVVNNTGWQADLLNHSCAGFDVDPRDHSAAARKLHRHLMDEEWLCEAGRNARDLAVNQFDRNMLAEKFERVLVSAIGS